MVLTRLILLVALITCSSVVLSQEEDPKEIKGILVFESENDALATWENLDRYYSYGIGISYTWEPRRFMGTQNWFKEQNGYALTVGIRSEGYTPTRDLLPQILEEIPELEFDRPFAGLLYGTAELTYSFERSYVRTGLMAGVMGPSAFAGDIQNWIHDNVAIGGIINGWEFQLPDQLILNASFRYAYDITQDHPWFDLYSIADARLGNLYVDARGTLGLRIGRFNSLINSVSERNDIFTTRRKGELFFRGSFSVTGVAFDGTAQGNMFKSRYVYALSSVPPVYLNATFGAYWSFKRWVLAFDHTIDWGKVISNSRHSYARIELQYRI